MEQTQIGRPDKFQEAEVQDLVIFLQRAQGARTAIDDDAARAARVGMISSVRESVCVGLRPQSRFCGSVALAEVGLGDPGVDEVTVCGPKVPEGHFIAPGGTVERTLCPIDGSIPPPTSQTGILRTLVLGSGSNEKVLQAQGQEPALRGVHAKSSREIDCFGAVPNTGVTPNNHVTPKLFREDQAVYASTAPPP